MLMSKVMVVLSEELLKEVDRAAKQEGTNRSALIRKAVGAYLNHLRLNRLRKRLAKDAEELARLYPAISLELGEEAWMLAENEALLDFEKGG